VTSKNYELTFVAVSVSLLPSFSSLRYRYSFQRIFSNIFKSCCFLRSKGQVPYPINDTNTGWTVYLCTGFQRYTDDGSIGMRVLRFSGAQPTDSRTL
jgi:hypothetical protein